MAVTKLQKFATDFWPYFHRVAVTLILISQLVSLVITAAVMFTLGLLASDPVIFAGILVIQVVLGTVTAIILYQFAVQPIKDLLAAIIHISGEPTQTTPPNPNDKRFAQSGFKDILQTLYELASKKEDLTATAQPTVATNTPGAGSATSILQSALNKTSSGFVIMNHARQITFSNNAAPISVNTDGSASLSLIFNGQETLDAWLDECDQNAVQAERTWSRVPNKLPEEDGRRFFDVIASYDKGAESEIVLTLIDRTNLYSIGEQELDFIAFAAHELRGPITVIRGYLDVLQGELQDVLKDDQEVLFHRLTVSANRLSGYINNILNTSRYDRRHLKMHLEETTVKDVYDTIRDDMNLRANAQNRILNIAIPEDLPSIAGDPASLGEVFGNLIDNAIKYSNEGGVINVSAASAGDRIDIAIEDHGIGMPGNVIGNLFQKFYRSHRSRETVAGTGIGLYISKAIIESHGGKIGVRSEDGRGSTFTVSLPTYQSVAEKLKAGDNSNEGIIDQGSGWIKNHSTYRG